jgi:hypothetical protein
MRPRITYANVAATLALVLSMSGGALAANQYLISSSSQISPKLLKKLKGRVGKTGVTGKEGPAGKEGPQGKEGAVGKEGAAGKEGPKGTYPETLASGHSETGNYAVAGGDSATGFMTQGFTFPQPLPAALDEAHAIWVVKNTTDPPNCPGPGEAARGYLCVYENFGANDVPDNEHAVSTFIGQGGSDSTGFMLFFEISKALAFSYGNWTVTAP